MARRASRAQMLAHCALAVAGGLPVPDSIQFGSAKYRHLSVELDTVGDFEQWARMLGVQDHNVHADDDNNGARYRSSFVNDWHGWPVHVRCNETVRKVVSAETVEQLREFADADIPETSSPDNEGEN